MMTRADDAPTVAQVIEYLQTLPADWLVLVSGYEGEYNGASIEGEVMTVEHRPNASWYYGCYSKAEPGRAAVAI